jgi:MSHA biogenesis protein MshI
MRLFRKKKTSAGWMAISFVPEGVCVAHVSSGVGSRPAVTLGGIYPLNGNDQATMEKLARDLGMGSHRCTTLLGPRDYHMLLVDAPNVPPEELKTAIRWRIKDLLDYHIDDATIDVLDIPPDKNAPVRNHSMYAIAANNSVIQARENLFERADIPLSVIDIPEMAQRNIAALLEPQGRGLAMLAFSGDGGLLTITYGGELYLSRRIDIPLEQIVGATDEQRDGFFDRIALELQRSLDHFDRQFHFIAVAKLVLAPFAKARELQSYLSSNLYVPVEVLDLEQILDCSRVPELKQPDRQGLCFYALGAAMRVEEKAL